MHPPAQSPSTLTQYFSKPFTQSLTLQLLILIKFLIIVFHCPYRTALHNAFLSYIIPSYWVVSLEVVRHHRLGPDDSVAISYLLDFFQLFKFGGVYSVGAHAALWVEDRKHVPVHDR